MSWMSPKERFYTCVAHKQPDRPPIQFYTTPEFEAKLQERFPGQNLLEVLEVDFRTVGVPRKKPLRQPETGSKVAYYDEWGIGYARQSYGFGEYLEAYELPFASMTTLREVEEYPWPSVDDYDFSHLKEDCKAVGDYVVCFGHAGIPDIINGVSRGRGMEQVLIDIRTESERTAAIFLRLRTASSPIHRWTTCLLPTKWSPANGCASRSSLGLLSNPRLVV
jgi:hypothetical protein